MGGELMPLTIGDVLAVKYGRTDRDALRRAGAPDGAAGMSRAQWDVYLAARELFYRWPGVRIRTSESPERATIRVSATAPGDVERTVSVSRYDVLAGAPLVALWDLRDAIPTGAPPWQ